MTVGELVDILKECDRDVEVLRHDSEWGDVDTHDVDITSYEVIIS